MIAFSIAFGMAALLAAFAWWRATSGDSIWQNSEPRYVVQTDQENRHAQTMVDYCNCGIDRFAALIGVDRRLGGRLQCGSMPVRSRGRFLLFSHLAGPSSLKTGTVVHEKASNAT